MKLSLMHEMSVTTGAIAAPVGFTKKKKRKKINEYLGVTRVGQGMPINNINTKEVEIPQPKKKIFKSNIKKI